jgi:hypothetical protein
VMASFRPDPFAALVRPWNAAQAQAVERSGFRRPAVAPS